MSEKKIRFKFSYLLIIFFIILIVLFLAFRFNSQNQYKSQLDILKAEGYPVTIEELEQLYAIPETAENAAILILDAATKHKEPNDYDLIPISGKAKLPARTELLSGEIVNAVSDYINDNHVSLDLLHKASLLQYSRYPANPGQSPKVIDVVKMVKLLNIEALLYAENNNAQAAAESIIASLNIADSVTKYPYIVCQLVNIIGQETTVSTLERIVNRVDFNEEQLEKLFKEITEKQNLSGLSYGFMGELCNSIILYDNTNNQKNNNQSQGLIYSLYNALGITRRNAMFYFDFMKKYIEAGKLPLDKRMQEVQKIGNEVQRISRNRLFFKAVYPNHTKSFSEEINNIAKLRACQIALAIERFRLKNKRLPDSLEELIGDCFNEVPLDPFDGKGLRYKKLDKGFIVYSVGEDKIDDGGKEQAKGNSNSPYDITFIIEK
ncbi:MAG: hypothetical protein JXA96_01605 [Sedimentisphaerales bacterium]|nr:hypothetical protein [Sedimentisphaerales bacterium]